MSNKVVAVKVVRSKGICSYLKIKTVRFSDRFDVEYKKKRDVKDHPNIFSLSLGKIELYLLT